MSDNIINQRTLTRHVRCCYSSCRWSPPQSRVATVRGRGARAGQKLRERVRGTCNEPLKPKPARYWTCNYVQLIECKIHSVHWTKLQHNDWDQQLACKHTVWNDGQQLIQAEVHVLRGIKGVPRKGVWTSVSMRVWTGKELRARRDRTSCYRRPPEDISSLLSVTPKRVSENGEHEKLTESWRKADTFGEFRGVLARKADAFGYPFQLTNFSSPISGPLIMDMTSGREATRPGKTAAGTRAPCRRRSKRDSFQKTEFLKNGPSPWEIWTLKGHLEVNICGGSGIWDPQLEALQLEIMRTKPAEPRERQLTRHTTSKHATQDVDMTAVCIFTCVLCYHDFNKTCCRAWLSMFIIMCM